MKTRESEIRYPVDEFLPLGDSIGICVVPEPVVMRKNSVKNVKSLVSAVGSSLSIMFYIVVLVTFLASNEHFPGYGVI